MLPEDGLPEVAVVGRSNVGKSSLLNALVGRRQIARTSQTPGKTQALKFYRVEMAPEEPGASEPGRPAFAFYLVDLPGYGYAKVSQAQRAAWQRLAARYLDQRATGPLRVVCLLIDSRHGLKDVDREVMEMLDTAAVSYHLVLTKADKVKPTALEAVLEATRTEALRHPAAHPLLFATSSETGQGIAELRTAILEAALS